IQYDTRDFLTNAFKGIYLRLDQRFNPRFLLNKYAFSLTELDFSVYHGLWRDATLAFRLHSRVTYGNTPWGLLSTLGGSYNMRGYFEGRYRDKSAIDVCLELRQHVWRRNGIALWVGAGTVFPKFSALRWNQVLPNYGIGYRWEFKKRVNVRLDLGFGRHQTGFIFSINEAF
ncbi:MAG: outer membrane protein assembly factor, partial [Muribaculaceae bacterium]|nr:outer membrane protein assembly factor [Muribaculaceae bacterium]